MTIEDRARFELEELDRLYTSIINAQDPQKARTKFNDRLPEATKRLKENTHPLVTKTISDHWVNHFSHILQKEGPLELFTPDLDLFIDYVARHKLATALFREPPAANLLACLCLARIYARDCGNVHPKQNNVADVIEQWTAQEVPSRVLRDVSSAVEFLFGSACLTLYRNDVVYEAQLPKYLWSLSPPLQHLNKVDLAETLNTSLPCDLS